MKITIGKEKIGKLEFLVQKPYSTIYKETLDGQVYCLKKYQGWENLSVHDIVQSYVNYAQFHLEESEHIVKVFNVFSEGNIVYIRMEYLEGYISLRDWLIFNKDQTKRNEVILKIFNTLVDITARGGLYSDCGDGNWMINKDLDVKLIDLDVLNVQRVNNLHFLGLGFMDLLQKFRIEPNPFKLEPEDIIEPAEIITDSLPYRKEILKKTSLYKGGELILDCGCAEGNFIGDFASLYKKVIAFDPNIKSVELAKKQTSQFKNVEIYHSGFKAFEPKGIKPNVVWIGNCLHYIFIEYEGFDFYSKLLGIATNYLVIEYPPDINIKSHDMEQLKAILIDKKLEHLYTRYNILKILAQDYDLVEILKSFTVTREILVLKRRK